MERFSYTRLRSTENLGRSFALSRLLGLEAESHGKDSGTRRYLAALYRFAPWRIVALP